MIPEYELINQLQNIQMCFANSLPAEINRSALSILKEHEKEAIHQSVDIVLNQEEYSPRQSSEALKLLASFTRLAVNFQFLHDLTNLWLSDNDELEAGVNKKGEIILWTKQDPSNTFPTSFRSNLV